MNLEVARLRDRTPTASPITWPRTCARRACLAAMTGDRAGAVRAYRHYLALRSDPEPVLRPAVDTIRAELTKLVGSS